jgi:hypothetical protein
MPQKNAIITFTVGDTSDYDRLFLPSVKAYASRIGADFHQIREFLKPIDMTTLSPLMQKHVICMQKMLIASLPWVQEYDWVLLIDADILVNYESSPNIFDQVQDGFICGVNERLQFGLEDYNKVVWSRFAPHLPGDCEGYYKRLGFDRSFPAQINGGFLVFQPRLQATFFKSIYDKYMPQILEQNRDCDYDQGPLNYEGWSAGILHCLDPRWNRVWLLTQVLLYPFLDERRDRLQMQQALKNMFDLNYCIHMAGRVGWSLLQ